MRNSTTLTNNELMQQNSALKEHNKVLAQDLEKTRQNFSKKQNVGPTQNYNPQNDTQFISKFNQTQGEIEGIKANFNTLMTILSNKEKQPEKTSPNSILENKLNNQTKKVAEKEIGPAVRGQAFTWIDEYSKNTTENNLSQQPNDSNLPGSCDDFFGNNSEPEFSNKKNDTNQLIKNISKNQTETEIYRDRQSSQRNRRSSVKSIKEVFDREDAQSVASSNSRFKENYKGIKQNIIQNLQSESHNQSYPGATMVYPKPTIFVKKPVDVNDEYDTNKFF